MFRCIKNVFFTAMTFSSFNPLSVNSLDCVSMSNQESKIKTKIIDVNNNEPLFHPFRVKVNKCSGSCNNINNPYSKLCFLNVVKNINVKLFNLMSRTNETRHIEWYETCECRCRLDASVCNNKQRWNEDKCRYECREELIDNGRWDKEFYGILMIVIVSVINHVM